jgi:DNA-binding NtrC family response regulator
MAKILLVDEDPLHASVRKAILERKYPDVWRIADAAEALGLMEQRRFAHDVQLVVTSDQHSGMGLVGFVSELNQRIPELPILVIGEYQASYGALSGLPVEFLSRPVTSDDLLNAVSKMLGTWKRPHLKTA